MGIFARTTRTRFTEITRHSAVYHRTVFQRIITRDECWFFSYYPHHSTWAAFPDELPERVTQKIDTGTRPISMLWSVNKIHSLIDLPKGNTYNTAVFCDHVVPSAVQGVIFHARRKTLQGFIIHLDNVSPHNSRKSQE
jgi:hypothetical protein